MFDILCNHMGGTLFKYLYGDLSKADRSRAVGSQD